jgi:hypothetical protein
MLSSRRKDIQALARLITYRFADYIQRASALITYQPAKAAWIKNQAAVDCLIFCGIASNWIADR